MKVTPLVSIIILSAEDGDITVECLSTLSKNTRYSALEVIVVHNGSSIKQRVFLEKEAGKLKRLKVRFLRYKSNLGYAKGNNQAARAAKGELIVFLNNDVIVTKGWLTKLVTFLESSHGVVACQPKLHSNIEKDYFDYAGGAGGFLDMFGYPFTRGRVFNSIEKDVGQYDDNQKITWASGSCLVIKARFFREVGGFDEYFFSYMEEVDLCLRLKKIGCDIYCVPSVKVFHYGAYTSNKDLKRKIFLNHRNNLYFVFKHYSIWPYFPIILMRILFDLMSVFYYLSELRLSFVAAVVDAYVSLVGDFPELVKKDVISLSGRSLMVDETVYRGSVVLEHFLMRKNSFSEFFGKKSKRVSEYKKYKEITYFIK